MPRDPVLHIPGLLAGRSLLRPVETALLELQIHIVLYATLALSLWMETLLVLPVRLIVLVFWGAGRANAKMDFLSRALAKHSHVYHALTIKTLLQLHALPGTVSFLLRVVATRY